MPLKHSKILKFNDFKEITTFVSLTWPSSQNFDILFGLATEPRSFPTGLFLFYPLPLKILRNLVFIPVKLIKKANEEGWLRSLAYFIRMKSLYVNNTHYGFNLRGLGKILNCSPACLSHHLKILRSRELVGDHSGNITFKGLRKISLLYGGKNIGVPVDPINQLDLLRAQLIRFNLSGQEYNIKRSGVQKCPAAETPNTFSERAYSCYAGLSAHGFGKVLKLSPAQGAALRAKMIRLGILSFIRRYSIYFAFGDPSGEAPSGGVLRTALRQGKIQGLIPSYAFIKDGRVLAERRMELEYMRA